jgi:signal transduction histidine kinase/ActR/RegA family two-component response regulator
MITQTEHAIDHRVVLLAPTRKDAATTVALLEGAGIAVHACPDFDDAFHQLSVGAALFLVPEELLGPAQRANLGRFLREQPPWADLPLLVLAQTGANSAATEDAVRTLGNVTLLERPMRVATLLSAVRSAMRARQRQYQIREYLEDRARIEDALRLTDQRKDEFLATLGHELRNPLAPLQTGMHLLRLGRLDRTRTTNVLDVMGRQVTHLVRLVDDLLEVSRVTRGLIDVRFEAVDLVTVVRAAVESCLPMIRAADHQIDISLPATPIPVSGDAVRLTQVFTNLLTNASKYSDSGGRIMVRAAVEYDRAVVSVRDTGIGIPPAYLGSVFDMFMQVERSSRRAQGGLGIGLTLVRTLVEMHHGRVEAHSAGPGTGSEFVVTLPLLTTARTESMTSSTLQAFPKRRILIVDDNRDAGDTLGTLLEALGCIVQVVNSGRAALSSLDTFRPDTVLLDIGMPELDGYEVARRIRALPDHAGLLLVALTGWGQYQDQRRARAAGFDHHMVKPPDIERLRQLLLAETP